MGVGDVISTDKYMSVSWILEKTARVQFRNRPDNPHKTIQFDWLRWCPLHLATAYRAVLSLREWLVASLLVCAFKYFFEIWWCRPSLVESYWVSDIVDQICTLLHALTSYYPMRGPRRSIINARRRCLGGVKNYSSSSRDLLCQLKQRTLLDSTPADTYQFSSEKYRCWCWSWRQALWIQQLSWNGMFSVGR